METRHFHSNGKLLITSEFLVIDGAPALAVPCQYGQYMEVIPIEEPEILLESYTDEGKMWYDGVFSVTASGIKNIYGSVYGTEEERAAEKSVSQRLEQIFNAMQHMKPHFFEKGGFVIKNRLNFPRQWGLGTSSTLLSNLSAWAGINPYSLSEATFGGSGYDIACARAAGPILYQRTAGQPVIREVDFKPDFSDELFFVYLNQKQNTREMVTHYKKVSPADKRQKIEEAGSITHAVIHCKTIAEWERLIDRHEALLSSVLNQPTVKQKYFSDYPRSIKSLGAWGGDFILAAGHLEERRYFEQKGYPAIVKYKDMVKNRI